MTRAAGRIRTRPVNAYTVRDLIERQNPGRSIDPAFYQDERITEALEYRLTEAGEYRTLE